MDILDKLFQNNNLKDPDDIDALLECATVVRQLIGEKDYLFINKVITYTVTNNCYEAFLWTVGILQEEFEKTDCSLENLVCNLGGCINSYDEFVQALQVDFNSINNEIQKVYDENGEVGAFFNVMTYKTAFENVYLISSENFDNKDNDYIQYRLSFVKN